MQKILTPSLPDALDAGRYAIRKIRTAAGVLTLAWRVAAERRQLASLDDAMLKDIGLSRSVAYEEASKTFLDVPESRLPRVR